MHTALLLAGLTARSERRDGGGRRSLAAVRSAPKAAAPLRSANRITLDLGDDDDDDDDDDLIDEDDLLANAAPPPPTSSAPRSKSDDCGGRRPCDDCTCGRREAYEGGDSTTALPPKSACGNCGKGDAFRCAGCPYLGQPAFKKGEEGGRLVLDLADDL